jgi:hypothetical protein
MQHLFDVDIAIKYGVDVAIFVKNLAYWVAHNQAESKNCHDGRYWSYNTLDAFPKHFPYWSTKQIRRIIDQCVEHGLIVKGNYNKQRYDRTVWYSLTDMGHELLNLPICPNGQIDATKRADQDDQMGAPIPDNKHIYKTTNKRESVGAEERATPLPLSDDFLPNEEVKQLAKQRGIDFDRSFEVFKIKKKGRKSKNWHDELKVWILNEKVTGKSMATTPPKNEIRSTVPEFEPEPAYSRAKPETVAKHIGDIMVKLKGLQGSSHNGTGLSGRN